MDVADGADAAPVCNEVLELLSSGVVMALATRDAALTPECVPAMGLRLHRDRRQITLFVPQVLAAATLANVADNGQVALCICRPVDDKTFQVKGRALAVRQADAADRATQEVYRGALAEQLALVGLPRGVTRSLTWWPSTAIDVEVREVFVQTPGPGAGNRLAR